MSEYSNYAGGEPPPADAWTVFAAPIANFSLPTPGKGIGARVFILPGDRISRIDKRGVDKVDHAYVFIEADPLDPTVPPPLPASFDQSSLRWALRKATLIVLWAGQQPPDAPAFTATLARHAVEGGRIVLLLLRDSTLLAWRAFVESVDTGAELLTVHGAATMPGLWMVPTGPLEHPATAAV